MLLVVGGQVVRGGRAEEEPGARGGRPPWCQVGGGEAQLRQTGREGGVLRLVLVMVLFFR